MRDAKTKLLGANCQLCRTLRTKQSVSNIIKKPIDGLANYHVKFILNAL